MLVILISLIENKVLEQKNEEFKVFWSENALFKKRIWLLTIQGSTQYKICKGKLTLAGAVVVAKLVERSHPISAARSSNPVIGKIYIEYLFTVNCINKKQIKKNRGR